MSEKSNHFTMGMFIVGALLIAVTIIKFAIGTGFGEDKETVIMIFEGSVKGLSVGAPVTLRGVQIGQVTGIELQLESDSAKLIMRVEAEISGENIRRTGDLRENLLDEMIDHGLRAQLNTQSILTGLLYVQMDFHPEKESILVDINSPYQQIPTIPTNLERLTQELESFDLVKLAKDVESIASNVSKFVGHEDFQNLPAQLSATINSIEVLTDQLRTQVDSTGSRLDNLLDNANSTVDLANAELPEIALLVQKNLTELKQAINQFETGMQNFNGLVDYDSTTVYELNRTLKELGEAGRALKHLVRSLEDNPESLLRGRKEEE